MKVPGTSIAYKTYIEGEGGYDSNPDSLFNQKGTSFEKVEGSFKVLSNTPTETYELSVKAKDVQFNDLEIDNRWDFKTALDTSFVISSSQKLSVGAYYLRDFFSLDRMDVGHTYAEYAVTGADWRVKIETRSHIEHNLGSDTKSPNEVQDDFDVSKGAAFDYLRNDGRVSGIFATTSMLQPFFIYDYGDLDYYNQVAGASIDRNARDQFVVAGLRVEFDKTFRVDIGGRYNHRDFDDTTFTKFDRGFIDINAFWQPVEAFKASLVVERFTREPSTSFGLADDVRTVGVTADWQIDPYWRMSAAGYYDRVDAIGDDFRYNKYTGVLSVTYEPTKSVEIFLSGLGKYVTEEFSDENYTRYKIGSGVRFKF